MPPDKPRAVCFDQCSWRLTEVSQANTTDRIHVAPDHHQAALRLMSMPSAHNLPHTRAYTGVHPR